MTSPCRYCVYVTQKVKGPLLLKLGKNEAERFDMWLLKWRYTWYIFNKSIFHYEYSKYI